jgi:hypothetical protein
VLRITQIVKQLESRHDRAAKKQAKQSQQQQRVAEKIKLEEERNESRQAGPVPEQVQKRLLEQVQKRNMALFNNQAANQRAPAKAPAVAKQKPQQLRASAPAAEQQRRAIEDYEQRKNDRPPPASEQDALVREFEDAAVQAEQRRLLEFYERKKQEERDRIASSRSYPRANPPNQQDSGVCVVM